MKKNKKEFRHHYIPQFLIKKFAIDQDKRKNQDDYPVYVYDTETNKERIDIPRNILYKSFLNSFKIDQIREYVEFYVKEGGDASNLVNINITAGYEDAWARFDNYVSSIYQEIDTADADVELRALISFFFSGSYIRNLKYINRIQYHNNFLKESYYEYERTHNTDYDFDNDILNEDELKFLYYQYVFTGKDSFQLFTEYFPIILESNSKFILGDTPIVILNYFKDYINTIGLNNQGTFAITPISKDKTILLLPFSFVDNILDIFEMLKNNEECIDVTTGLTVENNKIIRIVDHTINAILYPTNGSRKLPLVHYQCNDRDIELLNFLQIANSRRMIISDQSLSENIQKIFYDKPILKERNNKLKRRYLKIGENSKFETFELNPHDNNEEKDVLFHISENRIYYNDLKGFYRTIIFKIQKSLRVGFEMIKEKEYGNILQVKKGT